ncbi:MAG: DsrE family protein [Proteobacteria bacterium]|nr:DsrE family protein [Pseudomonadota bacterium]MBU1057353.1 DsrE family protein [Pseudomonadota bacterium]
MLRPLYTLLTFLLAVFVLPQIASASKQNDLEALHNLPGLKAYFDVKDDSAAKIEQRLIWINDIYEQMSQKGLKATFVIGFRSQASFFVTKGDEYIEEEDLATKGKIENWLKHFVKLGIPLEQCGLSAKLFDIDSQDFLPELTVVTNGYISMIGYQNKGYAYVPM